MEFIDYLKTPTQFTHLGARIPKVVGVKDSHMHWTQRFTHALDTETHTCTGHRDSHMHWTETQTCTGHRDSHMHWTQRLTHALDTETHTCTGHRDSHMHWTQRLAHALDTETHTCTGHRDSHSLSLSHLPPPTSGCSPVWTTRNWQDLAGQGSGRGGKCAFHLHRRLRFCGDVCRLVTNTRTLVQTYLCSQHSITPPPPQHPCNSHPSTY